jgi:hypothetical protein
MPLDDQRNAEPPTFGSLTLEIIAISLIFAAGLLVLELVSWTAPSPHFNAASAWLGIVYDLSSIAVTVTAWFALSFARAQAQNSLRQNRILAEQTAISSNALNAEVYRHLMQDLRSSSFRKATSLCLAWINGHRKSTGPDATATLGDYAARQIAILMNDGHGDYQDLMDFFAILESVGFQARRGYLSLDDLHDLLSGSIRLFDTVFRLHLQQMAQIQTGVYQHTLWLFSTMSSYQPNRPLSAPGGGIADS